MARRKVLQIALVPFNRTTMELKQEIGGGMPPGFLPFNRTTMELKLGWGWCVGGLISRF